MIYWPTPLTHVHFLMIQMRKSCLLVSPRSLFPSFNHTHMSLLSNILPSPWGSCTGSSSSHPLNVNHGYLYQEAVRPSLHVSRLTALASSVQRVYAIGWIYAEWLTTCLWKRTTIHLHMHSAWPRLSLSTNTSRFENTKWANEMTAGTRTDGKKCHQRGNVHVWAHKKLSYISV